MYKTVVIEYSPKADDMAQKVEGASYYVNYRNSKSNFSI